MEATKNENKETYLENTNSSHINDDITLKDQLKKYYDSILWSTILGIFIPPFFLVTLTVNKKMKPLETFKWEQLDDNTFKYSKKITISILIPTVIAGTVWILISGATLIIYGLGIFLFIMFIVCWAPHAYTYTKITSETPHNKYKEYQNNNNNETNISHSDISHTDDLIINVNTNEQK